MDGAAARAAVTGRRPHTHCTYLAEATFAEHNEEIEVGRTDEVLLRDAVRGDGSRRRRADVVVAAGSGVVGLARSLIDDHTRRTGD